MRGGPLPEQEDAPQGRLSLPLGQFGSSLAEVLGSSLGEDSEAAVAAGSTGLVVGSAFEAVVPARAASEGGAALYLGGGTRIGGNPLAGGPLDD